MQKVFVILGSFLLASTLAAAQNESPKGLGVEKAVVAASVENREPAGGAYMAYWAMCADFGTMSRMLLRRGRPRFYRLGFAVR